MCWCHLFEMCQENQTGALGEGEWSNLSLVTNQRAPTTSELYIICPLKLSRLQGFTVSGTSNCEATTRRWKHEAFIKIKFFPGPPIGIHGPEMELQHLQTSVFWQRWLTQASTNLGIGVITMTTTKKIKTWQYFISDWFSVLKYSATGFTCTGYFLVSPTKVNFFYTPSKLISMN